MRKSSFHILRVGLAITFVWIGVLIFKQPAAWGGYLQPWAAGLIPLPMDQMMLGTAVFDIIIGILLLVDVFVWAVALLAALHVAVVLTVSGITDITVRDIAIIAGALALVVDAMPPAVAARLRSKHTPADTQNKNT